MPPAPARVRGGAGFFALVSPGGITLARKFPGGQESAGEAFVSGVRLRQVNLGKGERCKEYT